MYAHEFTPHVRQPWKQRLSNEYLELSQSIAAKHPCTLPKKLKLRMTENGGNIALAPTCKHTVVGLSVNMGWESDQPEKSQVLQLSVSGRFWHLHESVNHQNRLGLGEVYWNSIFIVRAYCRSRWSLDLCRHVDVICKALAFLKTASTKVALYVAIKIIIICCRNTLTLCRLTNISCTGIL